MLASPLTGRFVLLANVNTGASYDNRELARLWKELTKEEHLVTPACNHCTLCPHIMMGVGASGSHAALRRQAPFKSAHISGPL
jgi:hypothetical protein